jgi:Fe-S-cluster containining protein
VTIEEIGLMAKRLSMSADEFIDKYVTVTKVGYLLSQTENGCVFLTLESGTSKASCTVYPVRPTSCRNWVASLSRRECQKGLVKLKINNEMLLSVGEVYDDQEQIERFCTLLTQPEISQMSK